MLYRAIDDPTFDVKYSTDITLDPDLLYEGMEEYVEEATKTLFDYEYAMKSIMYQYGVMYEAEAISGSIYKQNNLHHHHHILPRQPLYVRT